MSDRACVRVWRTSSTFHVGDIWFRQVPTVGEFVMLPGEDVSLRVSRVVHYPSNGPAASAAAIWVEPNDGACAILPASVAKELAGMPRTRDPFKSINDALTRVSLAVEMEGDAEATDDGVVYRIDEAMAFLLHARAFLSANQKGWVR